MTSDFTRKTRLCADYLRSVLQDSRETPADAKDSRFRDWQTATYEESGFLDTGDFFAVYEKCRNKAPDMLTSNEVRGCVTFLLRQMRYEYPPYSCIENGELLALLERWLEL